jgi:hypothetical protein
LTKPEVREFGADNPCRTHHQLSAGALEGKELELGAQRAGAGGKKRKKAR